MPGLADKDHERLSRAWKTYQARRRRADNRRLKENELALAELARVILRLKEAGYSMGDMGRELGMTRQAVYDLLRRAQADRS
jgi:hypothetical protein